ncbi:MAG TPA: HAD family hydrolase [Planctomycetota bacterium]|jgi:phosphoglycolate phosphatase|nr:HAD family hydrolase [Planctomycetota bacterium]
MLHVEAGGPPPRIPMPTGFPRIPGTSVEIVKQPPRGRIRHCLLDFDGTLSYLRDGWQDFMVPLMVEVLEACPRHESREELEALVIDFVDHLTGKQTIYQMLRLVEEVEKRGGTPRPALEYKQEYNQRVSRGVASRMEALRSGKAAPEEFLVLGARAFLDRLVDSGISCYLASGTDVEYVTEEVRLLGLERYFEDRVYGALPNYKDFSKEKVILAIISEHQLEGGGLLVAGDGYVEIQNGRDVDAVTLGVYTPEKNRYHMNDNKRERLFRAGAHLLALDFAESDAILSYLRVS